MGAVGGKYRAIAVRHASRRAGERAMKMKCGIVRVIVIVAVGFMPARAHFQEGKLEQGASKYWPGTGYAHRHRALEL